MLYTIVQHRIFILIAQHQYLIHTTTGICLRVRSTRTFVHSTKRNFFTVTRAIGLCPGNTAFQPHASGNHFSIFALRVDRVQSILILCKPDRCVVVRSNLRALRQHVRRPRSARQQGQRTRPQRGQRSNS